MMRHTLRGGVYTAGATLPSEPLNLLCDARTALPESAASLVKKEERARFRSFTFDKNGVVVEAAVPLVGLVSPLSVFALLGFEQSQLIQAQYRYKPTQQQVTVSMRRSFIDESRRA